MARFTLIGLLTLLLGTPYAQQQEPPPADPHVGQPAYCVNHGGHPDKPMVEPHICECEHMEDGSEDRRCLVFCRKDACHCIHEIERKPPQ